MVARRLLPAQLQPVQRRLYRHDGPFRVVLTARRPLPIHPDEPTFSVSVGMSQKGPCLKGDHNRTWEPSCVARNDVEQMRQHEFWRIIKWSFPDPDGPHSLVEAFCRRFGVDHPRWCIAQRAEPDPLFPPATEFSPEGRCYS